MASAELCPICFEESNDDKKEKLPCNHEFHTECIIKALRINPKCPICRDPGVDTRQNICIICMNTIGESYKIKLRCQHTFHPDCAIRAFRLQPDCPICGDKGFDVDDIATYYDIRQSFTQNWINNQNRPMPMPNAIITRFHRNQKQRMFRLLIFTLGTAVVLAISIGLIFKYLF